MYLDANTLADQVTTYNHISALVNERKTQKRLALQRQAADALVRSAYLIAEGYVSRYKWTTNDVDDFRQDAALVILEKAHRYDRTKGNAFNYFTTVLSNHLKQAHRTNATRRRVVERYAEHLRETTR